MGKGKDVAIRKTNTRISLKETKPKFLDYYFMLALLVLLVIYLLNIFTQNPIIEYYRPLIDLVALIILIIGFVRWVERAPVDYNSSGAIQS